MTPRILEPHPWKLEVEVLEVGSSGSWKLVAGSRKLYIKGWNLGAASCKLDVGSLLLEGVSCKLDVRSWELEVGS